MSEPTTYTLPPDSDMAQATNGVRQEIKFYRVLLLNAALSALFEQHIAKGDHLPSVRELNEEIKDYWRGLTNDACCSGVFADMDMADVERLLSSLALDLPMYG